MYKVEATVVYLTIVGHHTIAWPSADVAKDANKNTRK